MAGNRQDRLRGSPRRCGVTDAESALRDLIQAPFPTRSCCTTRLSAVRKQREIPATQLAVEIGDTTVPPSLPSVSYTLKISARPGRAS